MKNIISFLWSQYLIRLLAFWMILFAFYRLVFIIYLNTIIPDGMLYEALLSFIYAFRLDFSTACAAASVPFIFWSIFQFSKSNIIKHANTFFNISIISIVTLFSIGNVKIYEEWGTPLSARALHYLLYPKEILSFMTVDNAILVFSIITALIIISIKLHRKFVINFSSQINKKSSKIILVSIIPVLLVIGYRGGLQLAPINESAAYYSTSQINNHIATNNMWYLAHSILDANDTKTPYHYMDLSKAKSTTQQLYNSTSDSTISIIKKPKPNIVIIVLESWTSDIIAALDGEKGVTPNFDILREEGLLLSQMYSSGFRTEQGLISVLSGFPAQPNNSIITTPSKAEQLPSLTRELINQNYDPSFYYGGEVEFANMKSYLLFTGFETIIDKYNFEEEQLNSKWGAHDEYVFSKQLNDLKTTKEPFFSILLTLSTHEPFEVTMETPFNGKEKKERFKKAAYYTDHCLNEYFTEAKKQPWYENTLFVLVADHGHRLPKNRNMNYPEGRRITAMITGGALVDSLRGKTFDKICNQHDITSTILKQLELPYSDFNWSKNIFDVNAQEFAYYSNENSVGWVSPKQNIIYSLKSNEVLDIQAKSDTVLNKQALTNMKAYLQTLYNQYLEY